MVHEIQKGQYVEHKFRNPKEYIKVSSIKDTNLGINGSKEGIWFLDNVRHSTKLLHRIYNWFI